VARLLWEQCWYVAVGELQYQGCCVATGPARWCVPEQGQQAAYWLLLDTGEHHPKTPLLC
jgi:hypothetical protein